MFQAGDAAESKWHQYCCEKAMFVAALVIGTGVILEIWAVIRAPMGYQDESGFHMGVEHPGCKETQPG